MQFVCICLLDEIASCKLKYINILYLSNIYLTLRLATLFLHISIQNCTSVLELDAVCGRINLQFITVLLMDLLSKFKLTFVLRHLLALVLPHLQNIQMHVDEAACSPVSPNPLAAWWGTGILTSSEAPVSFYFFRNAGDTKTLNASRLTDISGFMARTNVTFVCRSYTPAPHNLNIIR